MCGCVFMSLLYIIRGFLGHEHPGPVTIIYQQINNPNVIAKDKNVWSSYIFIIRTWIVNLCIIIYIYVCTCVPIHFSMNTRSVYPCPPCTHETSSPPPPSLFVTVYHKCLKVCVRVVNSQIITSANIINTYTYRIRYYYYYYYKIAYIPFTRFDWLDSLHRPFPPFTRPLPFNTPLSPFAPLPSPDDYGLAAAIGMSCTINGRNSKNFQHAKDGLTTCF